MCRRWRSTGTAALPRSARAAATTRAGTLRRPPPLSWRATLANPDHPPGGRDMSKLAQPIQTLEEQCAARGMRMTEQRRIIAQVMEGATDHPDVEELYRRASE